MNKVILYVSFFSMIISTGSSFGQVSSGSEESLSLAHNLYISNQYAEAGPLYAQLLSNYPENSSYHYYYGVCMLFSSKNKAAAMRHLEKAATSKETPLMVYYYLGKANQLCYEFDKAIKSFEEFKLKANADYLKELKVDEQVAMCRNAMRVIFTQGEKNILSQSETDQDKFLLKYNFGTNDSKFLTIPDRLIKGKGNKEKFSKYVFVSTSGKYLVFSGPGKSGRQEIYLSKRKSSKDWDVPKAIKFNGNLVTEKINPVISKDGITIYFSSCCINSIGGYDVFSSTFDTKTKAWTVPVRLDSPVNSPFDDFYFVPSEEDGFAYVSSTRNCDDGEINVIKIKLEKEIVQANDPVTSSKREEIVPAMNKREINEVPDILNHKIPFDLISAPKQKAVHSNQTVQKEEKRNTNNITEERPVEENNKFISENKIQQQIIRGVFYSLDKPLSMDATITAVNIRDTTLVYRTETNPKTGEYIITLPSEGQYMFNIEKEGYHPTGNLMSITGNNKEVRQQMIINKDKKGRENFLVINSEPENKMFEQKESSSSEDKLIFKVQIGSYLAQTVEEIMHKYNKLGITEVNFITLKNGIHVFFTAETSDIFATMSKRNELVKKGFTDALVAAFKGEKQISINEALFQMK